MQNLATFFYQLAMKEYILASKSPRRKALLRNLIDSFIIINPEIKEAREKGEDPENYVQRIAELKALAVGKMVHSSPGREWVVIAADTIVVDGDSFLGKPLDEAQAVQMLTDLRGGSHTVFSGLAVYDISREEIQTRVVSSEVLMREYTEEEIAAYVVSGDPMDKAGAYAIQNHQFNPAPGFSNCYANVMGLPLCNLAALLHESGYPGRYDVAQRCQESIQYQCPIFSKILSGISRKD
jgi:septum formation protein